MAYNKSTRKKIAELQYSITSLLQTPIMTNISRLLRLPLCIQQKYLDALDKDKFEISHNTRTNCHFPIALETVASIAKTSSMESDDEFATRCACNISNLLNAYIIPVFLLRILTEPDEGLSGLSPRWSKVINVTCRLDHSHNESTGYTFDILKLIFHKKLSSDSECNEFFFVASEYIRQVVLSSERRVRSAAFYIQLPHEVVLNATSSLYSLSHAGLKSIAQSLQLLPIYRLILKNSTEDYGITRAPYNLGVVCALKSSLEEHKTATRPTLKQQCTSWIYVYGKKAELLPEDAFHIAPKNVKMDMLSLYEVDPNRMENTEISRYIFPIVCIEKEGLKYLEAIKPNLRAREIIIDSNSAKKNRYTIISLQPTSLTTAACTPETVAYYLQLLTASCQTLLGSNYRIMAYVNILQRMDTSGQDYKVFHILDIGTSPKECAEAALCDESKILIYDEARKNLNSSDCQPPAQQGCVQTLTSTLSCLLREASERHPSSGLTGMLEYLHMKSPDLGHFLKEHKMRLVLIIQEHKKRQHAVQEIQEEPNIARCVTETLSSESVGSSIATTSDAYQTPMSMHSTPTEDLSPSPVFAPAVASTPIASNKPVTVENTLNAASPHTHGVILPETTSKLTYTSSPHCHDKVSSDEQNTELTSHEVANKPSKNSIPELTGLMPNLLKYPTLQKKIDKVAQSVFSKTAYVYVSLFVLSACLYMSVIRSTFETQHILQYDAIFICVMLGAAALFFTLANAVCYHVTCKTLEKWMKSTKNPLADITLEDSTNENNPDVGKQKDLDKPAARGPSTNMAVTHDVTHHEFVLPLSSPYTGIV